MMPLVLVLTVSIAVFGWASASCAGSLPDEIVLPIYAPFAQLAGVQGAVHLTVDVSEKGGVTKVDVQQHQPMGLTENAKKAAVFWRFAPGLDKRSVALEFDFVLVPFSDRLPSPVVIDPHHVRIYGWDAMVAETGHWTPTSGKRFVKPADRPFLRLVRTPDGNYREGDTNRLPDVHLVSQNSCIGYNCSLCFPASSLYRGHEAPLHLPNPPTENKYVCLAGVLPHSR